MPNTIINKFSKETGKSKKEIEKYWNKAKEIVKDKLGYSESNKKFYPYVVTILKKMLKIKEDVDFKEDIDLKNKFKYINESVKEGSILVNGNKYYIVMDTNKDKLRIKELIKKGKSFEIPKTSKSIFINKNNLSDKCNCFKQLKNNEIPGKIKLGESSVYLSVCMKLNEKDEIPGKIKEIINEGRKSSGWEDKAYKKAKKGKKYSGAEIAKMGGVSKVAVQKALKKVFDKILKQLVKEFPDLKMSTLITYVASELGVPTTEFKDIKKVLPKWAIDELKKELRK